MMDFLTVPNQNSSDFQDGSPYGTPLPGSSRRTSHTGNQSGLTGLGYGFGVAWTHLRPFIPFLMISCLVVALVYLLQTIVYGGPFTDPLFFVKFNERWPRPDPNHLVAPGPTTPFSPTPTSPEQDLFDVRAGNGTI